MDPLLLAATTVSVLAVFLAGVLLWRDGRGGAAAARRHMTPVADRLARSQAELAGRLRQLAESQAAAQARMAERLTAQERLLARTLDERLDAAVRRVGDTLDRSTRETAATVTTLKERLAVIDAAQDNIRDLSQQMVGLQDILANKQARGVFGEIQLQDLIRSALPPSAYAFQAAIGDGRRADCVLELPDPPGRMAIDAKFPLEAYRRLVDAADEAGRREARRALGAAVLGHARDIRDRYVVPGETADSALMFLPSEAVYAELFASLGDVVEETFRLRVYVVSPTTLMATLNTVRAVLKDARMREQAHLIQREVALLAADVGQLDRRVESLGRHFGQAGEDVRQIRLSAERIGRHAERIETVELQGAELQGAELEGAEPEDAGAGGPAGAGPSRPRLVASRDVAPPNKETPG